MLQAWEENKYTALVERPEGKNCYEDINMYDNVKVNLKIKLCVKCIQLAQYKHKCRRFCENHHEPSCYKKCGKFLEHLRNR